MIKTPPRVKMASGERQAPGPMDGLDTAIPGRAFPRGQSMAKYHDDPSMMSKGGPTGKRR